MKRILSTVLTIWVLMLSPGLCLAGALEHFCADNPAGTSCEHENDCSNDPCGEVVLVKTPDPSKSNSTTVIDSLCAQAEIPEITANTPRTPAHTLRTLPVNLPVLPAELPLLS